jgi:hypothetical protein
MHTSDNISFDPRHLGVFYRQDICRHRIRDSNELRGAISALHDITGIIPLTYRSLKQSELDAIAAEEAEREKA